MQSVRLSQCSSGAKYMAHLERPRIIAMSLLKGMGNIYTGCLVINNNELPQCFAKDSSANLTGRFLLDKKKKYPDAPGIFRRLVIKDKNN